MKTFLFFILAFSTLAFGATRLPDYNSNNKYRYGTSLLDKEFEYETGGSNPKFSISKVNKDFSFNKTVRQKSNYSYVGDGIDSDKYYLWDIDGVSGPGTKPGFRWNSLTQTIQSSNDGSTWNDIGTGGGGGSSSLDTNSVYAFPNYASNPGFENGTNGWTASGGTFTVTPSYPNVGFGSYAGSWDASAANQTLTIDQQTIPGGLLSRSCMAEIYYKGGDSGMQLQVIDGSSIVLATVSMPTSVSYANTATTFSCPASGTFALRVKSTLSNGALIYLDKAFLGEAVRSPKDIYAAEISGGSCAINVGSAADVGTWNNTTGVTCTITPRVQKNIGGFTQAGTDQFGVTGYLNAHTYRICAGVHYETQLQGSGARINQSFRLAICAGSSACATTGETYFETPYIDFRNLNSAGTALYTANFGPCAFYTVATPGIYTMHMQETTNIYSVTSATNDIGCNTTNGVCTWQIDQLD